MPRALSQDLESVKEKKNNAIKRGHDRGKLEPFLRNFRISFLSITEFFENTSEIEYTFSNSAAETLWNAMGPLYRGRVLKPLKPLNPSKVVQSRSSEDV